MNFISLLKQGRDVTLSQYVCKLFFFPTALVRIEYLQKCLYIQLQQLVLVMYAPDERDSAHLFPLRG